MSIIVVVSMGRNAVDQSSCLNVDHDVGAEDGRIAAVRDKWGDCAMGQAWCWLKPSADCASCPVVNALDGDVMNIGWDGVVLKSECPCCQGLGGHVEVRLKTRKGHPGHQ